ncbi:hypothetical protein N665_0218s0039, partial [Sinapis alba]
YESLKRPRREGKKFFLRYVREVVRGEIHPNKIWMEDVDVIYSAICEKNISTWIGIEIHLMNNTITLFHCGLPNGDINVDIPLIHNLATLIPAILSEHLGEEINYANIIPFQVETAKGLPKTQFSFNCGLFVVKMLECSKMCCEIFNQFMDKDFKERYGK